VVWKAELNENGGMSIDDGITVEKQLMRRSYIYE
jgi:hypothetical protein